MKQYVIETSQLVLMTHTVSAESRVEALRKFRNGEAEQVDHSIGEELIEDVYVDGQ